MQRNLLLQSLRHLIHSRFAVACGFFATFVLLVLGWWMTDMELSSGNLWKTMFCFQVILYILFSLLFGIFVAASVYKLRLFGTYDKKNSGVGTLWWFVGILVAWCPACAVSLASYIWLASMVALLPRHGLELKIIGVVLVAYAAWKSLLSMEVCELRR